MRAENIKSLEQLSLFCHFSGLFSVFIGLVVGFMSLLNKDMRATQIAIYVFFTGYALAKISSKISSILLSESQNPS